MILNVGLKFPTIENLCYYPERKDPQARDPNLLVGLLSNYVVCPKRPFLLFYFSIYVKLKKFLKKMALTMRCVSFATLLLLISVFAKN